MKSFDVPKNFALFLVFSAIVFSCTSIPTLEDYEEKERLDIQNFLLNNDTIQFERKPSGLYYYDIEEGTGNRAEIHDTAYVYYAWLFLSGMVIETNFETVDTLIFPVSEGKLFIAGFDEGITYMNEGGRALMLVPSNLAFGSQGTLYISPYTPFLFQVHLVKLVKNQ